MTDKPKDESATGPAKPAQGEEEEGSFARTTLPYAVAALLTAAAMAWYLFVYVPTKLDYFVGLRFRTLAVASGQIASKIDSLARALSSVPNPETVAPDAVCPVLTSDQRDLRSKYVSIVLPEILLRAAAPAQGPQFKPCEAEAAASVTWGDVATQAADASRRDFDDLIIADSSGQVVWQRELTTPRIGNLSELLAAPSDTGGWLSLSWRERATMPAKKDPGNLRSSAVLKAVNLGGTSTLLLVQAVALNEKSITVSAVTDSAKQSEPALLYVGALVSRAGLQQQARRIPAAWVVLIALPIAVLFLAIPFVKLATLTNKERYRFSDVVLMILATIAASGLGAMIPFIVAPPTAPDATLERLSSAINGGLKAETTQVLQLVESILSGPGKIDEIAKGLTDCEALASGLSTGLDTKDRKACELWEALDNAAIPRSSLSIDLDVVIWFDDAGRQIRKWTTKRQVTGPTAHRPFDHYRAVTSDQLWTLSRSSDGASKRRFMIDPLRAPTTSEMGVVFVTRAQDTGDGKPAYLALNVRPQSIVDPLVPPGFGFAIIAPTGKVLFHSDDSLSLQENFFEEVGDPGAVRERARSNRVAQWSGDYHGRPHRFRLQPIDAFRDCPWLIVTFQEVTPVLSRELLQQTGTLRLGGLSLFILTVAALVFAASFRPKHQRARDFVQTMLAQTPANVAWVWVLPVLLFLQLWAIVQTYSPYAAGSLDRTYMVLVLIATLSLFVMALARTSPSQASDVPDKHRRFLATAELGLLVFVVGALPAVGFARIVIVAGETSDTQRWLGVVQQQWTARGARVAERLNGPNYSDELRARLENDFGAGPFSPDGRYTYLHVLDGVSVREGERMRSLPVTAGQEFVHSLLYWNLFSSTDEPVDTEVQQAIASHVLQIGPTGARNGSAEVATDVSWGALLIGVLIVGVSIAGVYFVRRKLTVSGSAAAPLFDETIRDADRAIRNDRDRRRGHAVVLLIGPARAEKDRAVRLGVKRVTSSEPVDRVRLLDDKTTVNKDYLDSEVRRVSRTIAECVTAGTLPNPCWIHVSNLETQLIDEESRTNILKVLERLLLEVPDRRGGLVVTSSVDPIEHFEEIFREERKGIYTNPVPEVALNRSVLMLSFFRRCYMPISPRKGRLTRCLNAGEAWARYRPSDWPDVLEAETSGFAPLTQVRDELLSTWSKRKEVPFDELLRTIRVRGSAYYELLWTSCTRSEKLVLIQLAQEGFVTSQSADIVAPLIAKGIIVERPTPVIFNRTFRDFLLDIERDEVIQKWERGEGHGLWVVSGRLIGSSLLAGGLFFLLTQDVSVQSLLPVVSGTGLFGIPLVRALLARLSGKTSDA